MAPPVEAVKLTPASVTLATGTMQQFSFTGLMSNGTTTAIPATWTATGGSMSAAGLYTAGGTAGTYRVIAVQQGGSLADTSAVTVTGGGAPGTGDVVQVSGVPVIDHKWLLRDSDSGGACPDDAVTVFTGVELPIDAPDSACATEFAIFAKGFAPTLDLAPTSALVSGQHVFTEQLGAAWVVNVTVIGEYPDAINLEASMEIDIASTHYHNNRMGMAFVLTESTLLDTSDPIADAIKNGCAATAAVLGLVATDGLTLIYVRAKQDPAEEEQWPFPNAVGYNCVLEGFPGLIFIKQDHPPSLLAHEIGHALSLKHAGLGSTNPLYQYGWAESNLMRTGIWVVCETGPCAYEQATAFSLGQAYRANFHDSSWLNSSGLRSGNLKPCQQIWEHDWPSSAATWPCPLLHLDQP